MLTNHFSDSDIKKDILNLLCNIAATGNEADKCHVAQTFSSIKWQDEQIITTLKQMVVDQDIDVCIDAMQALGSIGTENAIETITQSLINDPEGEVKEAAVGALGNIGGKNVIDTLCKVALNRPDDMSSMNDDWDNWWDIQRQAIKGLSHTNNSKAVNTLVTILEDKDEIYQDLESEIFKALVLNGEKGEEQVLQQLKTGKELNRRRAAIALSYSKNKNTIKPLGRALSDKSSDVKINTINSLVKREAKQYRAAIELLVRDTDPFVRQAALSALNRLGLDSESLKDENNLLRHLKSDSVYLLNFVLHYLQNNQKQITDAVEQQTIKLLDHQNAEVCNNAIKAINTEKEENNQLILNIINNDQSVIMIRVTAVTAAKIENNEESISFSSLENLIDDKNSALRYAALSKLAKLAITSNDDENPALTTVLAIAKGVWQRKPEPEIESKYKTIPIYPEGKEISTQEVQQAPLPDPVKEEDLSTEGNAIVSTLDAISQSNTLNMLDSNVKEEEDDDDDDDEKTPINETQEELEEFEAIVAKNDYVANTRLMKEEVPFDIEIRQDMIHLLSDCPLKVVIENLITSLSSDNQNIRATSALSIANLALNDDLHEQVINAFGGLVMILETGEDTAKQYAIRALANIGNKGAMGRIAEFIDDTDEAIEIRNEAILALSKLLVEGKDPKKTDHMVFDHMETNEVVKIILKGYQDSDSTLRASSLRALQDIATLTLDKDITEHVINTIFDSLYNFYDNSLKQVSTVLTAFDPMLSSEKLIETLKTQEDMGIRKIALHVLSDMLNQQQIH